LGGDRVSEGAVMAAGRPAVNDPVISVEAVHSGYSSDVEILRGVSVDVRAGEIMSIVGANGAGKSTLLRTLFGLVRVSAGSISFENAPITNARPVDILDRGIAYVPQGRTNFPGMTVRENLQLAAFTRRHEPARTIDADIDELCDRFPVLRRHTARAANLSGGQQQVLEMAMALILHPKVLLIDEPTLGLSPLMMTEIFEIISQINATGTTVVMVEQNAKRSLEISHHAIVLDLGRTRFEGSGAEILANPEVRSHYLGL
jgi:ABC-type branched-subunit amino acid transport system ATPase component